MDLYILSDRNLLIFYNFFLSFNMILEVLTWRDFYISRDCWKVFINISQLRNFIKRIEKYNLFLYIKTSPSIKNFFFNFIPFNHIICLKVDCLRKISSKNIYISIFTSALLHTHTLTYFNWIFRFSCVIYNFSYQFIIYSELFLIEHKIQNSTRVHVHMTNVPNQMKTKILFVT